MLSQRFGWCLCVQTMQENLAKCDEMLHDIQHSEADEQVAVSDSDELSRVRRRYTILSEKVSKQRERVIHAAQLRQSYWTRRTSLETCLENCRREMSSLDSDDVDVDDRAAQLEASCCCIIVICHSIMYVRFYFSQT